MEHEISQVQKLIVELQQMIQLGQASLMDAMRNMLAEFMRDGGQSESGSAEGSAVVGESLAAAGPAAVGQSPAGAGPTAVRETILRDGGSRNFGANKLRFRLRLVQRGISQTSQEGLGRRVHVPAWWREETWYLATA